MPQKPKQQLEAFNTRLPEDIIRRVRLYAIQLNKPLQDVVAEILDKHTPHLKVTKSKG